ncbi:MAG: SLC13 family permease [Nitritalea sp.]
MTASSIGRLLGPAFFLFFLWSGIPAELSTEARAMLGITLWMATWWMTEAVPIPATALLPLLLFPLLGISSISTTAVPYAHPMVLLYMGGFMLAVSIEKWNLHKRLAIHVILLLGNHLRGILLGFMCATAFLSMWISNTATSLMMLPIGLAVTQQLDGANSSSRPSPTGKALMLGIAYSASIGGLATLIGTPTNITLSAMIQQFYGISIGFSQWMRFGLPVSLLLLAICWYYLAYHAFSFPKAPGLQEARAEVSQQLTALGPIRKPEVRVALVFGLVSMAWMFRSQLQTFIPALDDTLIALGGVLLLFILPAGEKNRPRVQLLDWKTAENIPWGILLLFGGGLALADGFQATGLAEAIGLRFALLETLPYLLFLLCIVFVVNFLTEITSNVATASVLLPILAAVSLQVGMHPYGLMVGATLAASCAFMLPVATPPNAVVFGSGYLEIRDMLKTGFLLNLLSVLLISLLVYLVLPLVWNIDLHHYPF